MATILTDEIIAAARDLEAACEAAGLDVHELSCAPGRKGVLTVVRAEGAHPHRIVRVTVYGGEYGVSREDARTGAIDGKPCDRAGLDELLREAAAWLTYPPTSAPAPPPAPGS